MPIQGLKGFSNNIFYPLIPRGLMIDYQNLQNKEFGPNIVPGPVPGIIGADPTVLCLPIYYAVDIVGSPLLHILIIQEPCKGYKAIKPIGNPFPSLGLTPYPFTVLYIGPELVQVTRQPSCLDPQLV